MKKAYGLWVSLLLCGSAAAAEHYQVSAKVFQGTQLLAEPEMVVTANTPASLALANGFDYRITVTPQQENTVAVDAVLTVGEQQLTPQMQLQLATPASIEVDNIRLMLTVNPAS